MNNPMGENEKMVQEEELVQERELDQAEQFEQEEQPVQSKSNVYREPRTQKTSKKSKKFVVLSAIAALLIAAAVVLVILFACDMQTETPVTQGPATNDYFVAESDLEKAVYTTASKLKGEIVDVYADKALVAIMTEELDVYNNDIDTAKLVNAITGEVYYEMSVDNPRGEAKKEIISAEFCDTCNLFVITIEYLKLEETDPEAKVERYHFTAEEEPQAVGISVDEVHECASIGDVYAVSIADTISFFDEDMNLLSDYNGDFLRVSDLPYLSADSYMVSEEEGYFYFFSRTEALVFDIDGVCTAKYELNHTKAYIISAHVINSGDVLIQYVSLVERDGDEYDFVTARQRYKLSSFVMNRNTGAMKEYELNYLVNELSAAYEDEPTEGAFPFTLASGYQNQAYISSIVDKRLSKTLDYVVLNNELAIEYTFPAAKENIDYTKAYAIDAERFIAPVIIGGNVAQMHIFDVCGNVIAAFPEGRVEITDSYIVTEKVIYDHNMKTVYNFSAEGYSLVGVCADKVYISRKSEMTLKLETYVYSSAAGKPVEVTNGIDRYVHTQGEGEVITLNYYILEDEDGWKTLYNVYDEAICKTDGIMSVEVIEGALLIRNTIDGEVRNYVAPLAVEAAPETEAAE